MWDACGGWYDNKSHLIQVGLEIIDELTKVLPSPDVHVGVILAEVIEPTLVHDEDSTSNDGSPAEWGGAKELWIMKPHSHSYSEVNHQKGIFSREKQQIKRDYFLYLFCQYLAQQLLSINYFAVIWLNMHHKRTASTNKIRAWLWYFKFSRVPQSH